MLQKSFSAVAKQACGDVSVRMVRSSILIPSASLATGVISFLILSGLFIPSFNPLFGVVEATKSGSFNYLTNVLPYETSEVSYNMEDMFNATHLYDFSPNNHLGKRNGLTEADGVYGQSLKWPSGQIVCDDLDIVDMSFTLEAWTYPTSEENIALAGCETVYPFIWKAQNGSMLYQHSGGVSSFYSSQPVGLNAWTHVALVYDAYSGIVKWYLNGSEQGSRQIDNFRDWDGRWSIGSMRPGYSSYEWKGRIDEFRLYKGIALTQDRIQRDMNTNIAHKLVITGLVANSDVAQLLYPDGEFAEEHKLEMVADEKGQVEFSIYTFSGRAKQYSAVVRVHRSGQTHVSPTLWLSWEDVYNFSVGSYFTEATFAALISGLIIIVPLIALLIYRYARKRSQSS